MKQLLERTLGVEGKKVSPRRADFREFCGLWGPEDLEPDKRTRAERYGFGGHALAFTSANTRLARSYSWRDTGCFSRARTSCTNLRAYLPSRTGVRLIGMAIVTPPELTGASCSREYTTVSAYSSSTAAIFSASRPRREAWFLM